MDLECLLLLYLSATLALDSNIKFPIPFPTDPDIITTSFFGQDVALHDSWTCNGKFSPLKCHCDDECVLLGDCCVDAFQGLNLNSSETILDALTNPIQWYEKRTGRKIQNYESALVRFGECTVINNKRKMRMITRCPDSYINPDVKKKCTDFDSNDIRNTPVNIRNGTKIRITFRNLFCALCHEIKESQVEFWKVSALCPRHSLLHNMSYDEYVSAITKCSLTFVPNSEDHNRVCVNRQKGGCRDTDTDYILCKSYLTLNKCYVNPHCEACGNKTGEATTCEPSEEHKLGMGNVIRPSFAMTEQYGINLIFDFKLDVRLKFDGFKHDNKQINYTCGNHDFFDFIQERCRRRCPNGYIKIHNGGCVQNIYGMKFFSNFDGMGKPKSSNNTLDMMLRVVFNSIRTTEGVFVEIFEDIVKSLIKLVNRLDVNSVSGLDLTSNVTYKHVVSEHKLFCQKKMTLCSSKDGSLESLLTKITKWIQSIQMCWWNNKASTVEVILDNYKYFRNFYCDNSSIKTENGINFMPFSNTFNGYNDSGIQDPLSSSRYELIFNRVNPKGIFKSIEYCESIVAQQLRNCQVAEYSENEYVLDRNGFLFVEGHKILVSNDSYLFRNNSLLICSDIFSNLSTAFEHDSRHNKILELILTSSTLPISVFSLILLITIHFRHNELLTIHGKSLVSFSFTLIVAHLILLFRPIIYGIMCTIAAIMSHYAWLSVFTWSSVMAYDIARRFRPGTSITIPNSNGRQRFAIYSVIAWLFPAIIVSICCVIQFGNISSYPGYGADDNCWIRHSLASIFVMSGPIGLLLIFNCICFIMALYGIESSKRVTKLLVKHKKDKTVCLIYSRMFVFLGLTWIIGLITGFIHSSIAETFNLVINGLQGFFLFLGFTCNSRIIKLIFKSKKRNSDDTNGSKTT